MLFSAIRLKQNSGNVQHKEKIMIDLSLCEESALPESDQWWIEDLHLLESDKALIISGAWANSSVINASQCILSKQFDLWSFCFQDVSYGLTMNYSPVGNGFIQILHDSDRHHWLTVSNLGSDPPDNVYVYDSKFSCSSCSIRSQVACLMQTQRPSFMLSYVDMHMQDGYNDCGMFSIAYAVALCFGEQPGSLIFDQELMREHLCICIQQQHFSMFPVKGRRRRSLKLKRSESVKVYCICRMPHIPNQPDMICCSDCENWYHGNVCLPPESIPKEAWSKHIHWSCPRCIT